jgi:hypothetical protein
MLPALKRLPIVVPARQAASTDSLIERQRADREDEPAPLVQPVFEAHVADEQIQLRLEANRTEYQLPVTRTPEGAAPAGP